MSQNVEQHNMSDSKLAAALDLAAMGFRVFPLLPGGKMPAAKGWPGTASADPARVRDMWVDPVLEWESDSNIGVLTGDGLLVIDIDTKKHDGFASLLALELENDDLPRTPTAITPSGSQHVYLRDPAAATRNSASRIAPGVDIRAHHGYVVGPGSTIGGTPYRWLPGRSPRDMPIADAPDWLVKLCGQRTGPAPAATSVAPAVDLDSEFAIARARRYLQQDAAPSIEGAGGNENAFRVCCVVKDMGVSEGAALDLMLDHWNERCAPPWAVDELADIAAHAWRYGTSRPGAQSPAADFAGVAMADAAAGGDPVFDDAPARPRLTLDLWRDVAPDLDQVDLIADLLGEGTGSVLYGASNTGKTFLALEMAHCIATGRPFFGRRVEQGGVVYVAAEASASARKRIRALKLRYPDDGDVPFALVPCPVDLLRPTGDTKGLIDLIGEAAAAMGVPVKLVVVDTLSRAMAGGNENGPEDMGQLVKNLDRIRVASGAHVMVVHHSGKDEAKGARGHSLLRAAVDTELEVADGILSATKQRDVEYGPAMGFALDVVEIGTKPERAGGGPVTSCVVVPRDLAAGEGAGAGLGAGADGGAGASAERDFGAVALSFAEREGMAALAAAAAWSAQWRGDGSGVQWAIWLAAFYDVSALLPDGTLAPWLPTLRNHKAERQLFRLRTSLVEKDEIVKLENGRWAIMGGAKTPTNPECQHDVSAMSAAVLTNDDVSGRADIADKLPAFLH